MDEARRQAARAARGDRQALAELLRGLQDPLYRVCRMRLGDRHAAQDATQEAAHRIVCGIGGFQGASSVQTWAIGIAINVCREIQRKHGREVEDASGRLGDLASRHAGPGAAAASVEANQHVRRVVSELPTRQSEAVTLRYFEQLTVEQTAVAMGCSTGAVKAAVWQALRTMRTKLKDER